MPKAYSYIRFSRPEQLRGDSLRRQRQAASDWAAAKGLVIDESLTDLGVSAYRGANRVTGALGRFLKLVEDGKVERGSYLIIESLDRFSREEVIDVLPGFTALLKAGIIIVTLMDNQEFSRDRLKKEPHALLHAIISMMRANEESRVKSDRVGKAWARKREGDEVLTARVPAWLDVVVVDGKRKIVENPDRARVVKRIFAETIQGYGRRRIAERLDLSLDKPFAGGKRWQSSYIKKVLENRAVLGELQSLRRDDDGIRSPAGPPRPDYYPRIVDETTFLRANAAKDGRAAAPGKRGEGVTNILQGLTQCIVCKGRVIRENKGASAKSGRPHFVCTEARAKACTNDRRWPVEEVERTILGRLTSIDVSAVLGDVAPLALEPTIADLEAQVADRERRIGEFLTLVGDGNRYAIKLVEDLTAEVEALQSSLAKTRSQAKLRAAQPSVQERWAQFQRLKDRLRDAEGSERDNLRTRLAQELRSLLKAVRFSEWHIEAVYHRHLSPPGPLNREIVVSIFCDHPDYLREVREDLQADQETAMQQAGDLQRWLVTLTGIPTRHREDV